MKNKFYVGARVYDNDNRLGTVILVKTCGDLIVQLDDEDSPILYYPTEVNLLTPGTSLDEGKITINTGVPAGAGGSGGVKYDGGKPDLSLLPRTAKEGIAKAFMVGQVKYGRYNYKGGMEWTRLIAAADRHISAFNDGETNDPETGLCHLYHAGACIMMLIDYHTSQLGTDNRYKKDKK